MSKLKKAPLILICLAIPLAALAADFWTKKPYQTWSAEETRKMLEESPWATTLTIGGIQGNTISIDPPTNRGYDPSFSYTLQFRSARPIREAQVRAQQLNAHYDNMTVDQRAAFDANAAKFLSATFPGRVIVAVTFHTSAQGQDSWLSAYWARQSTDTLKTKVFLNTDEERLSLTSYSFNDDTFQFTFPRPKKLSPEGKISLEFAHPQFDRVHEQRIVPAFSLKKMLVDGHPAL